MSMHYIEKCSECGTVISRRCSDKNKEVRLSVCATCKAKKEAPAEPDRYTASEMRQMLLNWRPPDAAPAESERVGKLRDALKKIMERADEDLHGSVYFSMASRALERDDKNAKGE